MTDNLPETNAGFTFFELPTEQAALTEGREFDGMAEGEFEDMWGRGVWLKGEDWPDYLSNTLLAIEATRTEDGEIVGLPIDAQGHDNGDGAGWIVGISPAMSVHPDTGSPIKIFRMKPKWTDIGRDVISRGVRKLFSPTVNSTEKVIVGGSLTNWPATRTKKGRTILRPIVLSQSKGAMMENETQTPIQEPEAVAVETPAVVSLSLENLSLDADLAGKVQSFIAQRVTAGVEAGLKAAKSQAEVSDLCARLTGGADDAPFGLPVKQAELESFLLGLDETNRARAVSILSAIHQHGLVDFGEKGHSRKLQSLTQVPAEIKPILSSWVAAGGEVAEFFKINQAELGAMSDYDLAEFQTKKE